LLLKCSRVKIETLSLCQSKVNWGFEQQGNGFDQDSKTDIHGDDHITQMSSTGREGEMGRSSVNDTHTIILDLSTANFADTATVKTLKNIFLNYRKIDIDIYLTGCQVCVVEQLSSAGFFSESIPKSCLFTTIHDAVLHSLRLHGASDVPIIYEYALVSGGDFELLSCYYFLGYLEMH
ncbi:unnamed protein product, partial [Oncorhynchus mykiss]